MNNHPCQLHCVDNISEGRLRIKSPSFRKRLMLIVHRRLGYRREQWLKKQLALLLNRLARVSRRADASGSSAELVGAGTRGLKAGDLVRVRSENEIRTTLDRWNGLKGCIFMQEMLPYCGTTQRVLKPVEKFLDERDYQMKKTKGIVLLDDVICEGTAAYGPCDRACFFFWREEWLEKLTD